MDTLDLRGVRAAVVGGTGGLGRAIALTLAGRGARVTVVGRTFRDQGAPGIEHVSADLGLLREASRVGRELPAEELDLLILTTGITPARQREETPEGIERDLAVSYLSRLVLLREMVPRLGIGRPSDRAGRKPRVFVMGFPGNGQAGAVGDLNAERSYGAMATHMNTVAGNELLVHDGAARHPEVLFFGLNPGLIRTGIRENLLGKTSWVSWLVEGLIGWFNITPEAYAARTVPLLVTPDLEARSGALFGQSGQALDPTPKLLERDHAQAFLAESEALVARATA